VAALRDPRVRRALNYAIDVPTMIKSLMHGSTVPLASVVNPPNANPDLTPYGYHPDRAKQLLAEAGFPNGFDLDIDFTPMWGQDKDVSETVAGYLNAVGIRTHLHADEWNDFRGYAIAGEALRFLFHDNHVRGDHFLDHQWVAVGAPMVPTPGW